MSDLHHYFSRLAGWRGQEETAPDTFGNITENLSIEKGEELVVWAKDFLKENGPNLLLAVVTLVVGFWVISRIVKVVEKGLSLRKIDHSLKPFLLSLTSALLRVLLLLSVASMVGIETTSFVAIMGAATLAIGMALQGSLGNFAGGVMILVFKPYKVGDLIEAQGHTGTVQAIHVFNTIVLTPDNLTAIIPNGAISGGNVLNYSREPWRRVDLVIGISYDADIRTAKGIAQKVMEAHPKVLKDPAPYVAVDSLGDNSVNLAVRPHCLNEDYWAVYFDIQEEVKYAFDEAGIGIPYPQRDVHIYNHSTN